MTHPLPLRKQLIAEAERHGDSEFRLLPFGLKILWPMVAARFPCQKPRIGFSLVHEAYRLAPLCCRDPQFPQSAVSTPRATRAAIFGSLQDSATPSTPTSGERTPVTPTAEQSSISATTASQLETPQLTVRPDFDVVTRAVQTAAEMGHGLGMIKWNETEALCSILYKSRPRQLHRFVDAVTVGRWDAVRDMKAEKLLPFELRVIGDEDMPSSIQATLGAEWD